MIPIAATPTDAAAKTLVRRLEARYLIVLVGVALLVAADQAVVQPLLARLDGFAPAINMAGRQRMISQRIAKSALALERLDNPGAAAHRCTELRRAVEQWSAAHDLLRRGDPQRGVTAVASSDIDRHWVDLDMHFKAIRSAALVLIDEPDDAETAAARPAALATIVEREGPYLESMDRVVKLLEEQSTARLRELQAYALGIAATIVALLVALGWFVVRPATRAIRMQVDCLESEVARQTAELADALSALHHEVEVRATAEEQNRQLGHRLAHADRIESTGHLAAGLAHELNQPLAAIANFAAACKVEMMRDVEDAVAQRTRSRELVSEIEAASLRAGQIVRRIRSFVRPDPGQTADVDLVALIGEVTQLCRAEATRSEVEFAVELPAARIPLRADPIQIQQVLVNLIQNALQAMRETPPAERRLSIHATLVADSVQVDVIDSGSGLAAADPEALFTPFHTTKDDGLGVGLAICRSIVEQHDGTIWARSAAAGGAQFSFTLPVADSVHARARHLQADGVCS